MKIGCRAHDQGKRPAEALAGLLREKGYHAAQLALPKALPDIAGNREVTMEQAEKIGQCFSNHGVEITVLGCYMDLSTPDENARRNGIDTVRHCLRLQTVMGSQMVGSETSYSRLDPEEKRKRIPRMTDSVLRIVEEAARLDTVFAIEPVFWHPLDCIEAVEKLFDTIADTKHFKLIFDPVNVLKPQDLTIQGKLWEQWLARMGSRIGAMHIKDVRIDGEGYRACPLGQGVVDYTRFRQWLAENRPEMPLLREEVQLPYEKADLAFLRGLVEKGEIK